MASPSSGFPNQKPLCHFQRLLFFLLIPQNHPIPLSPALGCGSFLPHKLHFSQLHSCHSLQMPLMVTSPSVHSHYPEIFFFKKPMSGICSFSQWNKNIPSPSPGARRTCFMLHSKLSHLALHSFRGRKPWLVMFARSSGKCYSSRQGWFQVTSVIAATSTQNPWQLNILLCDLEQAGSSTPMPVNPLFSLRPWAPGVLASEPSSGSSALPQHCTAHVRLFLPVMVDLYTCFCHFTSVLHAAIKNSPGMVYLSPPRSVTFSLFSHFPQHEATTPTAWYCALLMCVHSNCIAVCEALAPSWHTAKSSMNSWWMNDLKDSLLRQLTSSSSLHSTF